MSKLSTLRSRLAGLRRQRTMLRTGTGWFAVGIAILWIVMATFAVDWLLETSPTQRLVLWVIGLGAAVWAFLQYSKPYLGHSESVEDVALIVERQHGIDSDLVAAMQFESTAATQWGSPQLQNAVVHYVAEFSPDLDVYEGMDRTTFSRRALILTVTAAVVVAAVLLWPQHANAFFDRMMLGRAHYPTATRIDAISVNGVAIRPLDSDDLDRFTAERTSAYETQLELANQLEQSAAAARSVSGTSPGTWDAWFGSDDPVAVAARRLEQLGRDQRKLAERTRQHTASNDLSPLLREQRVVTGTLDDLVGRADLADVADTLTATRTMGHDAVAAIGRLGPTVPHGHEMSVRIEVSGEVPEAGELELVDLETGARTEVEFSPVSNSALVARLPRFVDSVRYQIRAGDAWTEPNVVAVVPLPTVAVSLEVTPPTYAAGTVEAAAPGQLQQSVVERSRIDFSVRCSNKQLRSAIATIGDRDYPLDSSDGYTWILDVEDSPFAMVTEAVHFAVEVEDVDGLSLERPLQGFVRIRPDRAPRIDADIKYGLPIALPAARRTLEFRASDDYGLSNVALSLEVEGDDGRQARVDYLADVPSISTSTPSREFVGDVEIEFDSLDAYLVDAENRRHSLRRVTPAGSSPIALAEGDLLKVVFAANDFRGPADPATTASEPITFRIGNEVEVLREMQKLDERAERDLDAIIRRELGIGEGQ